MFGYWDNITGNDFTSPDGSSNQLTLKPDLLYQRFGMACKFGKYLNYLNKFSLFKSELKWKTNYQVYEVT